jgi:hypothetical protein
MARSATKRRLRSSNASAQPARRRLTKPEKSNLRRGHVGERLSRAQDSIHDWMEVGAQVIGDEDMSQSCDMFPVAAMLSPCTADHMALRGGYRLPRLRCSSSS